MTNPKVSIIIACYNDINIVDAVRSAINQTYNNKEVILVDDGSEFEVAGIIKECSKQADLLLVQSNKGQSIARNNGIKHSSGKYILNHDSDDFFDPDFTAKAVEVMETREDVKIVTCKANRINNNKIIDIFSPAGGDFQSFLYSNSALGSSMFRSKDWERVGGYEENLPILGFEDWELYLNILKRGGKAYVIDEVLFNYRIRQNSTTALIKDLKNKKFRYIIRKHRELYINHFDGLIDHLFQKLDQHEKHFQKFQKKPEFQLGRILLKPVRLIKRIFK